MKQDTIARLGTLSSNTIASTPTVRRVLSQEYHKYRRHLKDLDPHSKYMRFGGHVSDQLIDSICDKLEAAMDNHVLFCVEGDALEFLGVGHIAVDGDEVELAFSVLPSCQGQGIGNALMRRCVQWCRTHGKLRGHVMCLSTNTAVRHLCSKHGMKLRTDGSETLSDFEFEMADVTTWISETADTNLAIFDWIQKRTNKMFKTALNLE